MLPRSFQWHQYYLALGLFCSSTALGIWVFDRALLFPFALCTMVLFSGSALVNAFAIRRNRREMSSVVAFESLSQSNKDDRW